MRHHLPVPLETIPFGSASSGREARSAVSNWGAGSSGIIGRVDNEEAKRVLDGVSAELRSEPYSELVARFLHEQDVREVAAESGVQYQVEVQAFWDSPHQPGNLRVLIAVDDGGWRAFSPLSTDFIVAPDGSFVGE